MNDVFKLENVVEGMKITTKGKLECDTCVQGKMSQYQNREPDCRASSPLQFVHSDLAVPITPESKDGHKYAMVFVDDMTIQVLSEYIFSKIRVMLLGQLSNSWLILHHMVQ